jgi:hypothetical protein
MAPVIGGHPSRPWLSRRVAPPAGSSSPSTTVAAWPRVTPPSPLSGGPTRCVTTNVFAPRSLPLAQGAGPARLPPRERKRRAGQGSVRRHDQPRVQHLFSVDNLVDLDDATHGIREYVEGLGDLMTELNVSDLFPVLRATRMAPYVRQVGTCWRRSSASWTAA